MSIFKLLAQGITWIFFAFLAVFAVFTITANTNILGNYHSFLVQSGSMEPTIMTGDIIVVHAEESYAVRDVITFRGEENRIVTHRIAKAEEKENGIIEYITKGDANRTEDEGFVNSENVVGKVSLVVPKLGFFVGFVQTVPGFIALIIVPAVGLIALEVFQIVKQLG